MQRLPAPLGPETPGPHWSARCQSLGGCLEGPTWLQNRNNKVYRGTLTGLQEGLWVSWSPEPDQLSLSVWPLGQDQALKAWSPFGED